MKLNNLLPEFIVSILLLTVSGCVTPVYSEPNRDTPESTVTASGAAPEKIRIASWNIENFGRAKATDEARIRTIAGILNGYGIIAIQEISNVNEKADSRCPRNQNACLRHKNCDLIRNALEKYLNQELHQNYEFVFSPHIKDERYLFIYDPDTVVLKESSLIIDSGDSTPICSASPENTGKMVHQPFKARFKAGSFDFILLTAHTRPSINIQELEGLEFFYKQVESEGEPDVIILGEFNADCDSLKETDAIALRDSAYIWVVGDDDDTSVAAEACAYDRFIFKSPTSEDFTGTWGINKDVANNISDHYLIWAEFWTNKDND